jgi:hypothetical protein
VVLEKVPGCVGKSCETRDLKGLDRAQFTVRQKREPRVGGANISQQNGVG